LQKAKQRITKNQPKTQPDKNDSCTSEHELFFELIFMLNIELFDKRGRNAFQEKRRQVLLVYYRLFLIIGLPLKLVWRLRMLDEKTAAILKIRAKLLDSARCWFKNNDYVEVQGPMIIPAVGNRPSSFEVKYFDKKAYLTQGLQPYAVAFLASLGKIYTIAPAFRAEKLSDRRHLAEYWRIEIAQKCEFDTIIRSMEKLVTHICQSLSKGLPEVFRHFNRSPQDLAKVQPPFPRLTYDQAIDTLQENGFNVSWGQKIHWELERYLSLKFKQPFFITNYPVGADTFLHKSDPEKPELTLSVDLIAPEGYGELSSGLQMITKTEVIAQKMAEMNIEPGDQLWYMSFMKCSSAPRSGFAMGLERLIQWICKLKHIKETIAFPRLYNTNSP
jgi:asparaginyl-tRNA synthetase